MESHPINHGRATRPLAPYIGGKRNLAARIIERIEKTPHDLYAEPFVGMGGVFLRRPMPAKVEVINDLSRDVATFFRILQRHYVPFLEMLRYQLTTRTDFARLMATAPDTLTDLERAARFLYLQRTAYGGKVDGRTFGVSRTAPARFNVVKLVPVLEEVHERLSSVTIECLPYPAFIERYDRAGALFYLDPPYWGCEGDYGKGAFEREDFERLAEILAGLKGRFILSLNDVPEVRRVFGRFRLATVPTTYTVAGGAAAKRVSEVIITGPPRRRR
jgi:DNA adenine methylase